MAGADTGGKSKAVYTPSFNQRTRISAKVYFRGEDAESE
jgi:hypothetical protein